MISGLLRGGKNNLALCYIEKFGAQMQTIDDVKAKIKVLVYNHKFDAAHKLMVTMIATVRDRNFVKGEGCRGGKEETAS